MRPTRWLQHDPVSTDVTGGYFLGRSDGGSRSKADRAGCQQQCVADRVVPGGKAAGSSGAQLHRCVVTVGPKRHGSVHDGLPAS